MHRVVFETQQQQISAAFCSSFLGRLAPLKPPASTAPRATQPLFLGSAAAPPAAAAAPAAPAALELASAACAGPLCPGGCPTVLPLRSPAPARMAHGPHSRFFPADGGAFASAGPSTSAAAGGGRAGGAFANAPSSAPPHVCTSRCAYRKLFGNLFACPHSLVEHLCDRNCRFRSLDAAHGGTRCVLTGLLFPISADCGGGGGSGGGGGKRARTPSPQRRCFGRPSNGAGDDVMDAT